MDKNSFFDPHDFFDKYGKLDEEHLDDIAATFAADLLSAIDEDELEKELLDEEFDADEESDDDDEDGLKCLHCALPLLIALLMRRHMNDKTPSSPRKRKRVRVRVRRVQ